MRNTYKHTRRAFRFFHENAGYVLGERAIGALALARAEDWAHGAGLEYVWEYSVDPDTSWMDARQRECSNEFTDCVAYLDGVPVASLHEIYNADATYRRVVEAELALEAMGRECKPAGRVLSYYGWE